MFVVVAMTVTMTSCGSQQKVSTSPPPGVNAGPDGKPSYAYETYAGTPLQKSPVDENDAALRIAAIVAQRAAAMP